MLFLVPLSEGMCSQVSPGIFNYCPLLSIVCFDQMVLLACGFHLCLLKGSMICTYNESLIFLDNCRDSASHYLYLIIKD